MARPAADYWRKSDVTVCRFCGSAPRYVQEAHRRRRVAMAKKTNGRADLFDLARAGGLRKRVAKAIADADGAGKKSRKSAEKTVANLRSMLDELEDRATGGPKKRREA